MVSPFWRQLVERRASRFQFSSKGNALIADGYEIRYVELDNLEYGLIAVPVEPGLTGSETVLLRGHAAREATDRHLAFIETPGADENRARAMLAIQHCGLRVIGDLISKYGDNETVETSVPETVEFSIDAFDALDLNADGEVTPVEIADVERAPIPLDLMACIVRELRLGAGGERDSPMSAPQNRSLQHPAIDRRTAIQVGGIGLLGLAANHVDGLRALAEKPESLSKHKAVIYIFLSGGLAQHESFDPKPDAPVNIRGEFSPISTRTPGVQISEHLPMLASCSEKWAMVRSLTHPYNEHSIGHHVMLTGRTPTPRGFDGSKPKPTDDPTFASIVTGVVPPRNNLPPAAVLPEKLIHVTGRTIPGQFAGRMGSKHDPWFIEASRYRDTKYIHGAFPEYGFQRWEGAKTPANYEYGAPKLQLSHGILQNRFQSRVKLLKTIDRQQRHLDRTASISQFDRHRQQAISMLTTGGVHKALDVHSAPDRLQTRYGKNSFGWSLLMARQLVSAGVSMVQVNLGNDESWDTHEAAFKNLKNFLLPPTDRAVSALVGDLDERGMLDDVLIVMAGEFGRTPKVFTFKGAKSKLPGRDHWGAVQSVFFAGGGINGGTVVGSSDKIGGYPRSDPQKPENMAATIYQALGLPRTTAWHDALDRPNLAVEVAEMLSGCTARALDVTDERQIDEVIDWTIQEFGRLDIVVNNAGVNTLSHRVTIDEFPRAEWDRLLDVDLNGLFSVSKAAARVMRRQSSGKIINIASVAGLVPLRLQCAFVAAKAGVINLTKAMAIELGQFGILVNAIAPGSIMTQGTRDLFYGEDGQFHDSMQELLSHIPLGRPGTTDEIAHAALFLAAPESSYINGHTGSVICRIRLSASPNLTSRELARKRAECRDRDPGLIKTAKRFPPLSVGADLQAAGSAGRLASSPAALTWTPHLEVTELALNEESAALLARCQAGDEEAATLVFERYVRRLTTLARTHMSEKLQRRIDADDVVQSVFRSFFDKSDRYVHRRAGDLWRLLASITVNKVLGQAQFHRAAKRTMDADRGDSLANDHQGVRPEFVAREPTSDEIVAAVEELESVMSQLDLYQRTVLEQRLQGDSIEDIARASKRSERTVDSPQRAAALRELIRIDLEFRWRNVADDGETAVAQHTLHNYLESFPELTVEELADSGLIAEEYRVRTRWGDRPSASGLLQEYGLGEEHLPLLLAVDEELATEETVLRSTSTDEETVPTGEADNRTIEWSLSTDAEQAAPGPTFGDYEILHEIARGGMGVVYKARQTKLNRIVALKMIKAGELAGDEDIRRFQVEAEAAARLDHPHIVPIHEIGEDNGRHYFSMGFVDGAGLDAKLKDGPLDGRETAELMKNIVDAVHYAHENGVVHRDLKPGNILIDADGNPRITDFGLAKSTGTDSSLTATGNILGTPSYMPPEQAAGRTDEIGPLSDVYSLGAVLYCLLTGRPPFQSANVIDTLKQVLENDPVPPKQLNPTIDTDLETICLKCLEKEPARRYATAAELGNDLQRYRDGHPILARPIRLPARCWRWCKRNPLGATVAVLVMLLATGGPALALTLMRLNQDLSESLEAETEASALARKNERLASENASIANRNLDRADEVVKKYFTQVSESPLLLRNTPGAYRLRSKLLGLAREYYETFIRENENAEERLTPRLAHAHYRLGTVLKSMTGETQKALAEFKSAQTLFEQLSRDDPSATDYQDRLAASHQNIGDIFRKLGKPTESLAAYRASLRIRERLVNDNPTISRFRFGQSVTHYSIGVHYSQTGKRNEELAEYQTALRIQKALVNEEPELIEYRANLALIRHAIGMHYTQMGKTDEALEAYREAKQIREKLVQEYPQIGEYRNLLADSYESISSHHRRTGDTNHAIAAYRQAIQIYETLARENPDVIQYQRNLASCYNYGAMLYGGTGERKQELDANHEAGRFREALSAFQQARDILEKLVRNHPEATEYRNNLATSIFSIAGLYKSDGKLSNALSAYREALGIYQKLASRNPNVADYQQNLAQCHANLGELHRATGKTPEAISAHQRALKIRSELAKNHPETREYQKKLANSYHSIGVLHTNSGNTADALPAYQHALRINQKLANDHPEITEYQNDLATTYQNIGVHYQRIDDANAALAAYKSAIKLHEAVARKNPKVVKFRGSLAQCYNGVGLLFSRTGRTADAAAAYERAISIQEQLVRDHPETVEFVVSHAGTCSNLGELQRTLGNSTEALACYRKAIAGLQSVLKRIPGHSTSHRYLRTTYWSRARLFEQLGRHHEAANDWQDAFQLERGPGRSYFQIRYCIAIARLGRHADASKIGGTLWKQIKNAGRAYLVATAFSLCAAAAERDAQLDRDERQRVSDEYRHRCLVILKALHRSGFFGIAQGREFLLKDPDLNPLRHRDDFRQLAKSAGVDLPACAVKPRSTIALLRLSPSVAPNPRRKQATGARR
eukprot:g10208.t1